VLLIPLTLVAFLPVAAPLDKDDSSSKFAVGLMEAIDLVEKEHVQPTPRAKLVRWAVQGLYRKATEPLPAALSARLAVLEMAGPEEMFNVVRDARAFLGKHPALPEDADMKGSLDGLFARLEPAGRSEDRSRYITDEESGRGRCSPLVIGFGVGLRLKSDPATGMLQVVTPFYNGPAHKAGIRAGDLITHIRIDRDHDNNPLPEPRIYSTRGMTIERAFQLIMGPPETSITLTIIPAGGHKAAKKAAIR
jgi:hypothetical protein